MKHKKGSYKQIQERHPSKENSALGKAYRAGRSGNSSWDGGEAPASFTPLWIEQVSYYLEPWRAGKANCDFCRHYD